MNKMKLESVDVSYDIETDGINAIEHYVPTNDHKYEAVIECIGYATSIRRKLRMTENEFATKKSEWDQDGVIVRGYSVI